MKKSFRLYALIWVILLAVFNAVIFLVQPVIPGYIIDYDARFWISWAVVIAAFIGNLACAYAALNTKNAQKTFYRLPLITISYAGLVIISLCSIILMLIPNCPTWIAAIVCIVAFAFNLIAVIKACWASAAVSTVDEKVKEKTAFIKNITVDAENLANRAKSDAMKAKCKKVYEALRYSDPTSHPNLSSIETQIAAKMSELATAIGDDDTEKVASVADEIILLAKERNAKCKLLK